jgi:Domain of unknown function (DUF4157)
MSAADWEARRKTKPSAPSRPNQRRSPQADGEVAAQHHGSCACGGTCPECQAKREAMPVSRKGDAGEIAADRAADRVIRGESAAGMLDGAPMPATVARDGDGAAAATTPAGVDSALRASRGNGNPLDPSTRASMSDRFGHDFTGVRVHADSSAAALSDRLNAKAFTVGNDVYFNRGRFDPSSGQGERLLAHELAHVVQQGSGGQERLQRDIDDESIDDTSLMSDGAVDDDLAGADDAEPMDGGRGKCKASASKSFLLANSVSFDITVPKGCTATLDFTALWIPSGGTGVDCCTGSDTYTVTRNGKNPKSLPVGANVCGDGAEHVPAKGTIVVGGGYHKFEVKVSRAGCEGVKMDLQVGIKIR